jgi:phasin family protein
LLHCGKRAAKNGSGDGFHANTHAQAPPHAIIPKRKIMSHTYRDDVVASVTAPANACLALSKVYLEGVERLTSLNLNAAREALDSYASATKSLSEAKAGKDYGKFLSELGQPMFEKVVSHTRNVYEIMTKTQEELSTVLKEQFAHSPMAWADWAGGNALSAMFTKGLQQFTAAAKDNFAAASEAGSRVAAATTSNPRKIA